MLLRPAVALRGLECASSLQCFGDTHAREQTPPLRLLASRDFKWRCAVKVLSLAGDLQVPANRWWWRPKLVLISDKTHGRLQEVKKTPGFYREIFHCDSNFFFCQQLPSCPLGEECPHNLFLTFEQHCLFSWYWKRTKIAVIFNQTRGLCWKTVIYQWWVQPCMTKISSFTAWWVKQKELPFEGKMKHIL